MEGCSVHMWELLHIFACLQRPPRWVHGGIGLKTAYPIIVLVSSIGLKAAYHFIVLVSSPSVLWAC